MKNTNINELFFSKTSDFLDSYMTRQMMKSLNTVKAYRRNLGAFYDYVASTLQIQPLKFRFIDCTYQLLLNYVQYLQETRNLSSSSINQNIAAIKMYLKYSSSIDPSVLQTYLSICDLPCLTVTKLIRPTISEEGLSALFNAPPNTRLGNRDRTILVLMYDTAARVGEMVRIKLGDLSNLDSDRIRILLHGKGRKERIIVLSKDATEHLAAYLNEFHKDRRDPEMPLFYTKIHGELHFMSTRNMEHIVDKYGLIAKKQVPSLPKTHPHMLRRTRATDLYRDNVPLEIVSTILGHEQMETTRSHYATPSSEQLSSSTDKIYSGMKSEDPIWKDGLSELKARFGLT